MNQLLHADVKNKLTKPFVLMTFEKRVQRTRGITKTWCKIEMYTPKLPIAPTWGSYSYIYIYIYIYIQVASKTALCLPKCLTM